MSAVWQNIWTGLTTVTPLAHEVSIPMSAVKPPSATP